MAMIRFLLAVAIIAASAWSGAPARAATPADRLEAQQVVSAWYELVLELVRHTPTYSPPVASRSFAYIGVAAFEAVATGSPKLQSLAGQLNGLQAAPRRDGGKAYHDTAVVQAALSSVVQDLFANTGPTGRRVMAAFATKWRNAVAAGVPEEVVARSEAHGRAVAEHILAWSRDDGGAAVDNMGFPLDYELKPGPAHWVPTNLISQQQFPLLPEWGRNRTFAMSAGATCPLPPPPQYSEAESSAFYQEALEVHETRQSLTAEQAAIARFWSDDPMLSPTPPGHWISIALQVLKREDAGLDRSVDVLMRLGVAMADSFIACWQAKYEYDLVRPVTYIRRVIDPKWEALLVTPPFPEYPSGHSMQSAAAAEVLTRAFGENFAFEDATHSADGLPPRSFPSFRAAAEEAAISRLYGGIHFRAAIERGLEKGRCIAAYTNALSTIR
jgi:hypothetical protein